MTKIYRYVLVSDDGRAPCIDAGLVTLATCKPVIRRCASVGDFVIGFYPNKAPRGTLAWVGQVGSKYSHDEYGRSHDGRKDAVYRMDSTGRYRSLDAFYHPDHEQKTRDFANPVLIFDPAKTWYFGDKPKVVPEELMHLVPSGQGHRVNNREEGDLELLFQWLEKVGPAGIHGNPRHIQIEGCLPRPCGSPPKAHRQLRC